MKEFGSKWGGASLAPPLDLSVQIYDTANDAGKDE